MDRAILKQELKRDEGYKLTPYVCTAGHRTIGVGHNYDANPLPQYIAEFLRANGRITDGMADELLESDIDAAIHDLQTLPAWIAVKDDPVRSRVLVNMCFNMGIGKLLGFHNTLAYMATKNWAAAANGMQASAWASQVGARATRLVSMMRSGHA